MAYYYFKAGGTADKLGTDNGRTTTKRTGAWSGTTTDYYDSLYDVFAGDKPTIAPVAGDYILCSHLHSNAHTVSTTVSVVSGVIIMSVDNANQENYLKGATEGTTTYDTYKLLSVNASTLYSRGVNYSVGSHFYLNQEGCSYFFEDCDVSMIHVSASTIQTYGYATYLSLTNVALDMSAGVASLQMGRGSIIHWRGGSLTADITSTKLIQVDGQSGGEFLVEDVDLSVLSKDILDAALRTADDDVNVILRRCKISSGQVITTGSKTGFYATPATMESCDTGDGYHYYSYVWDNGEVSEDTAIYRTLGSTYDGTNGFSSELISTALASHSKPLVGAYTPFYVDVDTGDYTTDITFTAHFVVDGSATALNSDEVWLEVEYTDGLDNALGVVVTTKADPLATGTAPTTETALWTGLGGTNIQMSVSKTITIGTTAGTIASGVVRARLCLGKASQTIYACQEMVLS